MAQGFRKYKKSIRSKTLLAFILGCMAILISWGILEISFSRMTRLTNQMSEQDPPLKLVHQIFREMITLDQIQRSPVFRQAKTDEKVFKEQSDKVHQLLDSLMHSSQVIPGQLKRIDSMKVILEKRNLLFTDYLRLQKAVLKNDTIARHLKWMTQRIREAALQADSLVATEHTVTTTVIQPLDTFVSVQNSRPSLWQWLWGRKKKEAEVLKMQKLITREKNITTDTLTLRKEDSLLENAASVIIEAEVKRDHQQLALKNQQLELIAAGEIFMHQLSQLLKEIEEKEALRARQNAEHIAATMHTGLRRIHILVIVFIAGAAILVYFIFSDIFRMDAYRQELTLAKENAEKNAVEKQRFLAGMSHELRTPLQAIIGFSEQMKEQDAANTGDIEMVYQAGRYLLRTVNEILDYSRVASGKYLLHDHPFHMASLLTEVKNMMHVKARQKGLAFHYTSSVPGNTWYTGDAYRLQQILFNLLDNAVKFTQKGSVALSVNHTDEPEGTLFSIVISDTGSGITETEQQKIFEEFERAQTASGTQGSGLGLAIVKELVALHNGSISLHSRPGNGSTFKIQLRYPRAEPPGTGKGPEALTGLINPHALIWVIDDDPAIRKLCKAILEKQQIAHEVYASGQALPAEIPSSLALVLLDIRMPGENGYKVCQRIKEKTSVPVIALTAQVLPEEKEEIRQNGFEEILPKPFTTQELLKTIIRWTKQEEKAPERVKKKIADTTGEEGPLYHTILDTFCRETSQDTAALRQALHQNNREEITELLHRLAGRLSQFDAGETGGKARKLEVLLRNGQDIEIVKPSIETFCLQVTALLRDLQG